MFKLELKHQDIVLMEYTLKDGANLTIGRHPASDIVSEHKTVSRHHAYIERKEDSLFIYDRGSRNGTVVNGIKVESAQLYDEDIVGIGQETSIKVCIVSSETRESTLTLEYDTKPGLIVPSERNAGQLQEQGRV